MMHTIQAVDSVLVDAPIDPTAEKQTLRELIQEIDNRVEDVQDALADCCSVIETLGNTVGCDFIIKDLLLSGASTARSAIFIISSDSITVENCESHGWGVFGVFVNSGASFNVVNSAKCLFKHCIARASASAGFRLLRSVYSCFLDCKSQSNLTALVGHGFVFSDVPSPGTDNIAISCIAQNNGADGFNIEETN